MGSLYNEMMTLIDIGDVITTEIENINDSEGFEQPNRLDVFYFAKQNDWPFFN